ncbi:hypothetical protein LXL04_003634 [Taraxacum kok-saghyz]
MVGVNSSYSSFQNDVVFCLRVSKCRRFTLYPYSVVLPSRRLHPPVHMYQSNGSYFMFGLLLMSSSRYIFYFIVSLPIFSRPFFPFQTSAMLPFCCAGLPVLQVCEKLHRSLGESLWFSLYRFLLEDFLSLFQSFTGLLLKASGILCTGLRKMKLYSMPFSMHILLISLWRKLNRKICVEKTMNFRVFLFRVLVWRIVSQGDRALAETIWFSLYSFPEDAMFFLLLFQAVGIFYLCSASFRFCSTGLLLKPSAFLYMRTETMSLSDVVTPPDQWYWRKRPRVERDVIQVSQHIHI